MSQSNGTDYLYDGFIEEPDKTPQEQHFYSFKKFVEEYVENLTSKEVEINDGDDATLGKIWDSFNDCVKFKFQSYEVLRFDELMQTDNKLLQKILLVISVLCDEMKQLKELAEEKIYPPLSIFGDSVNEQLEEGEKQLMFGRSIPLLMDVWNYCERVNAVVTNVVRQLASIYNIKNTKTRNGLNSYLNVHFLPVYASLADLLSVMITLDEIIQNNQSFSVYLQLYNRMITRVMEEPERYGTDKKSVGRIQFLLQKLDGDVLDENIFKSCISQPFEDEAQGIIIQTNTTFQKEFMTNLESYFTSVTQDLNSAKETNSRYKFVGLCGLYILYYTLFMDTSNKKFFKKLWSIHTTLPIVHLYGNTVWSSAEFFLNKIPDMVRLLGIRNPRKEILDSRAYALKNLDSSIPAQVKALDISLAVWASRVESVLVFDKEGKDVVCEDCTLLLQGVQLAYSVSNLLRTFIYLHVMEQRPLTVSQVILLCRCVEMVKSIQATFHRKSASFAKHIAVFTEFLSCKIQKMLLPLRNRLEAKRKSNDIEADQLSATLLALHLLSGGAPSYKRILLTRLSLCVALQRLTGLLQNTEFEEIRTVLNRLENISQFESHLTHACDCSLLYWSRLIVDTFFCNVYQNPDRAAEMKHMFLALQDPEKILKSSTHMKDNMQLFEAYRKEILNSLEHNIITPLCTEIETDLRLHIHSAVIQTNNNISKMKGSMKDMTLFFKLRPIRFCDDLIDIKRRVSHYLDRTFYELTCITPHDHKTYEEMRNLANEKYGLEMTNVYLPGQTLEQGLDVLEITRNINVFVTRYSYNLNTNMFIEKCSATDAKNLNTIHIKHVANSIRTHGTGIMNTTVNFVYKFLGRKFYIFSQFLYDDHIKSRLIKDIRFYKDKAMELDNKYPLKQATSFIKYIKKLGVSPQGISYLDQFRQLITEIGNALGYVRMVRAGGLRYISDAIRFVPDLDNIENFEELVQAEAQQQGIPLSAETRQAARNLYQICTNLSQKFAEGSDYFKTLENVFTEEMQKEQNSHLRNFFIIVPALTISFVESMLISKDKMIRSGKEANFTNDGFALGVAFILKILNQNNRFDSLHWFESVAEHYDKEQLQLDSTMSEKKNQINMRNSTNIDDELQTMRLTMNRIKSYRREFELLFFSWNASRIFFYSSA
jgi:WASH complex subunit 7